MELFSLSSILILLVLSFANHTLALSDEQLLISPLQIHKEETCPYTLIVTTSCFSPDWTRDHITIALGDSDGNKVVAPRLDEPLSGGKGFQKCSSDTFQVKGQCLDTVCSVNIYRSGPDGWIPETVEIYQEGSKSVKFHFNKNVREKVWYGHNLCNNTGSSPPSPDFPPFHPTAPPPPSPDFPPFHPTAPPPHDTPSIPPPSPPTPPSAASGRGGFESLVGVFVLAFVTFVV